MKNLRLKAIATAIMLAANAYIVTDMITTTKERLLKHQRK
jgi:hypothetical protein